LLLSLFSVLSYDWASGFNIFFQKNPFISGFGDEELLEDVSRIQESCLEGSNRLIVERTGCTAFTVRFLSPSPTVGDEGTENL
jgi:hypothetical protein